MQVVSMPEVAMTTGQTVPQGRKEKTGTSVKANPEGEVLQAHKR
jgi:hypothetical protein